MESTVWFVVSVSRGQDPRGVTPFLMQPLTLFAWLGSEWSRRFPHHRMVGAAASIIFWIPVLREVFLYSGYASPLLGRTLFDALAPVRVMVGTGTRRVTCWPAL
jgi:hypothetical protein